ncbi:type II toxin-antitoxin system VapC family toxin [Psychrobacter sp. I-STPA6b]|uniref:type II toxin-antitoxin system VapC family toxin n=1 Tax=Psychrobacter sp. I-STPA6b TaxID=2585718 RepID=UPI001D0C0BB4|nr:type II toxin-antitoxin system VapC family toxin [Psychrobacter sp. I-STPA6b]
MYVLDTNTFSEVIRQCPNTNVLRKFKEHQSRIYLASIVWHELMYGTLIMANGKKRQGLAQFFYNEVAKFPILNYTKNCADIHASIRANAKQTGTPVAFVDSQIASVAMANDMILVTRNTKDFTMIDGLKLENWFE